MKKYEINKKEYRYRDIMLTISILLSAFFRQYASGIPGITLGDAILAISTVNVIIFSRNIKIDISRIKPLLCFWLFGLFISLVSLLFQQTMNADIITRFIRYSFYITVVIVSINRYSVQYMLNIYKVLCVMISLYIIIQVLAYNLGGVVLPFKILPIPWNGYNDFDVQMVEAFALKYYYRPSGVFIEPGYVAHFLLPGLAFSLYGWNKGIKINIKLSALIFSALILTTSSQGILIGAIIIGIYLIGLIRKRQKYSDLFRNIFIVFIVLILFTFSLNLDIVNTTINKVMAISNPGSSAAVRIARGFAVYYELPTLYKLIGVGHGNLGNFVIDNGITTKYNPAILTSAWADYASGASTVLLYYGVFGFFILLVLYCEFLRNTKGPYFLITCTFIILSFVSTSFFSILIVFYFPLIYSGYYKKSGELI